MKSRRKGPLKHFWEGKHPKKQLDSWDNGVFERGAKMAAKETVISVPDGYTVKEDCCEMSMNQAVTLLCSEQQEKYTCAV